MHRSERGARAKSPNGEWVFNTGAERDAAGALVIDDAAIAKWPGRPLSPAVADLIELGAAVQLVDRMERRPPARCGGDSWARKLRLVVGVRNPDLWGADGVSRQLRELLMWLTDDYWVIDFVARAGSVRPGESFRFLFENPTEGAVVSLYSGGLDSYAGLALELSEDTVPVLVSVVPNTRQGASQSHTLGSLQEQFGVAVPRVAVKSHLRGMQSRESSNRTRGFGFLAVAASVAAMSDISTVHVYENGIGAINLPYSRAQGGAQSTRSMHPKTLCRAGALFSAVLDHPIMLVNTNQYRTKGELCRQMPVALRSVVPRVHVLRHGVCSPGIQGSELRYLHVLPVAASSTMERGSGEIRSADAVPPRRCRCRDDHPSGTPRSQDDALASCTHGEGAERRQTDAEAAGGVSRTDRRVRCAAEFGPGNSRGRTDRWDARKVRGGVALVSGWDRFRVSNEFP